jgi:hypothetical protein
VVADSWESRVDGRGSFISATPAKGATAEVTGRPWKALAVPTADKSWGWGANGLSAVLSIALPWAVHRLALSLRFGTVAFSKSEQKFYSRRLF